MPPLIYQCPSCKNLVTVSAAMVDADRAGLVCAHCGTTTWLPGSSSPSDARASTAPRAATVSAPVIAPLVTVSNAWDADVRARIEERVAKVSPASPEQTETRAVFRRLLDAWGSDLEHKGFVKKASLAGELAYGGQLYRAVLDVAPLDPFAKKAQAEILSVAMATMSATRDIGSVEDKSSGRNMAFLIVGVLVMGALALVGAKLLKNAVGGDRIDAVDQ